MADNTVFDMGGLERLSSESKGETIQFGAFNGNMRISIFRGSGVKPTSHVVSSRCHYAIREAIQTVIKGGPSSSWPLRVTRYDPTLKKYVQVYALNFGKDANGMPFIDYTEEGSNTLRFPFRPDKTLDYGAALSDTDKANDALKAFYFFVTERWPHAAYFTRNNLVKKGQYGGGNNNRQSGGGQSSSSSSGSEDDIY